MNPLRLSYRTCYLLGLLICLLLLGYALFVQFHQHILPCPLCIFQRLAFGFIALWFLIGGLHAPRNGGRWVYAGLIVLGALAGIAIAGRQLWLQSLPPDQVPDCGPGLSYMLDAFPLGKTIKMVFTGSGECAEVNWSFLGLAMPAWTVVWYALLGAWALFAARLRGAR